MRRLTVRVAPASVLPGDESADIDVDGAAAPDVQDRRVLPGTVRRDDSGVTMVEVVVDGWRFELEVEDAARAELRRRATRAEARGSANGPAEIRAIIPGRVAAVRVVAGDQVTAGQGVLVVEAMKMQNELRAPRDGTVERVAVGEGETIEHGDLLVVLR
ncbi:MAG TPA: biotin/lipoyl-containing protein [Candidatus Limnocylindrales bacterium]|jgi:biotin carboxyl carrier protein